MKKMILVAANDFGSTKSNSSQSQTLEDLKSMILNHDFKSNFA
jgi:hypothetical protein